MAEKQGKTSRNPAPPAAADPATAYPYKIAVLARPDGRYAAGQAVTVDPAAPWTKGNPPAFHGDEEKMRAWRAAGEPLFVDHGRFNAWERDGFFGERKGGSK